MKTSRSFALMFLAVSMLFTCRETDSIEPNQSPVADAGEDMDVQSGETVSLDATGSYDPDGDSLSFTWTLLNAPDQSDVAIQYFDSVNARMIPDVSGVYTMRVTVSDNIDSDSDTVVVNVTNPNGAPVANAGFDAMVDLGTQFALNGNGTDPNGDVITYSWSLISKPQASTATIANPASRNTVIVIDVHGTYVVRLTVSDGSLSGTDDITIRTNAVSISGINPTSGIYGTTIKVNGNNFSPIVGENLVRINGMFATVTAASTTSLDVTIPKGAGTGIVTATVNGTTANGPVFTYLLSPSVSTVSQFQTPYYSASDSDGNIYISDFANNVIRRLSPAGVLTIIAGSGTAGFADAKDPLEAQFDGPAGLVVYGNYLYIADNRNHCIRRMTLPAGDVYTLAGFPQPGYADGPGPQAQFNAPIGVAADSQGNLYVGDTNNSRIRRINTLAQVSTLAGNGQTGFADGNGIAAQFNGIAGLAMDGNDILYVADVLNHSIRRIDGQGTVTTFAGNGTPGLVNGTGTGARFRNPYGVATDGSNNVYVADFSNHAIRRITPLRAVTTIAGNGTAGMVDGAGAVARFNQPSDVTVLANGSIYVVDFGNSRIRRIIFE